MEFYLYLYSMKSMCDPECWGISMTQGELFSSYIQGTMLDMSRSSEKYETLGAKAQGHGDTRGRASNQLLPGSEWRKPLLFSVAHQNDCMWTHMSLCMFTCVYVCLCGCVPWLHWACSHIYIQIVKERYKTWQKIGTNDSTSNKNVMRSKTWNPLCTSLENELFLCG